jgi:protein phosphatase
MINIQLKKNDDQEVNNCSLKLGELQYFSLKGPHHEINQDSLGIYEVAKNCVVLLVSDGMGGHAFGEKASQIVCDEFKKLPNDPNSLRENVINAIESAHEKVVNLKSGAGATLTLALIKDQYIRFINIGDSTQMLIGSRGKLKYQGIEHSPLGHGVEAGLIESKLDQDLVDDYILSNGIGFRKMRIEMSTKIELSEGDLVVLSSDGVSKVLGDEGLIEWASSLDFNTRSKKLVQKFLSSELELVDDTSLILFKYS